MNLPCLSRAEPSERASKPCSQTQWRKEAFSFSSTDIPEVLAIKPDLPKWNRVIVFNELIILFFSLNTCTWTASHDRGELGPDFGGDRSCPGRFPADLRKVRVFLWHRTIARYNAVHATRAAMVCLVWPGDWPSALTQLDHHFSSFRYFFSCCCQISLISSPGHVRKVRPKVLTSPAALHVHAWSSLGRAPCGAESALSEHFYFSPPSCQNL